MKINLRTICASVIIGLVFMISCKEETSVEELATKLVSSIKDRNAEQYYSLFPNSSQVAKYGFFAYGLHASTEEARAFWMRPYDQYSKSVDSLERVTKPLALEKIDQMFSEFHSQISWDSVEIESIDTLNTDIGRIGNLKDGGFVEQIGADMNVNLKYEEKRYVINCRDIAYIENEGWFLRTAGSMVKLEEKK